jgi:hypothetical protein
MSGKFIVTADASNIRQGLQHFLNFTQSLWLAEFFQTVQALVHTVESCKTLALAHCMCMCSLQMQYFSFIRGFHGAPGLVRPAVTFLNYACCSYGMFQLCLQVLFSKCPKTAGNEFLASAREVGYVLERWRATRDWSNVSTLSNSSSYQYLHRNGPASIFQGAATLTSKTSAQLCLTGSATAVQQGGSVQQGSCVEALLFLF